MIAVLLAIYGVYLDSQIRSRIDGKVWQLPAAVYGRMVNLEPGMPYSKKEMVNLLEGMQYRQVSRMTRPGEFTVQANSIEMLRRPFDFPDGKEGQIRARLDFQNNRLAKIWTAAAASASSASIRVLSPCCSRRTVNSVCSCRAPVSRICWWIR